MEQGAGADAACERKEPGAHPGRIGALGGEDVAVGGKPRVEVGALLDRGGRLLGVGGGIRDLAALLRDGAGSDLPRVLTARLTGSDTVRLEIAGGVAPFRTGQE